MFSCVTFTNDSKITLIYLNTVYLLLLSTKLLLLLFLRICRGDTIRINQINATELSISMYLI